MTKQEKEKKEQHLKICESLRIEAVTIPLITDVKDALKLLNKKPLIPTFKEVEKDLREYYIADWCLVMITRAMNLQPDGKIWEPNWNDRNEWKWQPYWFEVKADKAHPSGFGFSDSGYGGWSAGTVCGSRLCYKEENRGRFVMKQFEGLFVKKYLILK